MKGGKSIQKTINEGLKIKVNTQFKPNPHGMVSQVVGTLIFKVRNKEVEKYTCSKINSKSAVTPKAQEAVFSSSFRI